MLLALIQILYVDARAWNASGASLSDKMNQELIKLENSIDLKNNKLEIIDIHYSHIASEAYIAYRIDPINQVNNN